MTDEELILNSAREVAGKVQPIEVVLQPQTLIQMVGMLQLSLRHPAITSVHVTVARRFIDGARQYFDDCPAVLELIARGYDPSQDR